MIHSLVVALPLTLASYLSSTERSRSEVNRWTAHTGKHKSAARTPGSAAGTTGKLVGTSEGNIVCVCACFAGCGRGEKIWTPGADQGAL